MRKIARSFARRRIAARRLGTMIVVASALAFGLAACNAPSYGAGAAASGGAGPSARPVVAPAASGGGTRYGY